MLAFFFLLDKKRFENVAFHKRWRHDNQIIPCVFRKLKSMMIGGCYVFKFFRCSGRKTFEAFSE